MPVKKRKAKRREMVSPGALRWLRGEHRGETNDDENGWDLFELEETLRKTWAENREWVIAEHVAEAPGTRPEHWWQYDAPRPSAADATPYGGNQPELRQRIGGTGDLQSDRLAVVPRSAFGIPAGWVTAGLARFINKAGTPVDPEDPPIFEAQASYLDRHGLFLPGERKRLRKADFELEVVELQD